MLNRLGLFLLSVLPKNALSLLAGRLAYVPLPRLLRSAAIRWFSQRYAALLEEAELKPEEYPSLGEFFVRNLKAGRRPIGPEIVSPVDGALIASGALAERRLLQVKELSCTLDELLGDDMLCARYEKGTFVTLYLAPGDYHHFHAPVDGRIRSITHVEGTLFPVNAWSVRQVPRLYARNERVILPLETADSLVTVIAVGAMNVGSVALGFFPLRTNAELRLRRDRTTRHSVSHTVAKGERLGSFRLGSTVILLFEPHAIVLHPRSAKVKLGETIASWSTSPQ